MVDGFLKTQLTMDSKPIKTDRDYRAALKEVEKLMAAEPNTPEGEILIVLVRLIEAYERDYCSLKV
jgi:HTH-type transcriptional regulator / antitoxin HigA